MKLLYSKKKISERVRDLGKKITEDYKGNDIIVVPVLKGSILFAADLIREIQLPIRMDFIRIVSYDGTESTGKVEFHYAGDLDWTGKHVLIIEDIVDTGLTLSVLKQYLQLTKNVKSIKTCTLINKYPRRKVKIEPDYYGFTLKENHFVVGYGLDDNEFDRNLGEIYYI
jgi:hypoxanthine phosphoribosyltransferase